MGTGAPFVVREGYVRSLRDQVRRQTFPMPLYVVHGEEGGGSSLVEQEGTPPVLEGRDEGTLPEDIRPEDILPDDNIP